MQTTPHVIKILAATIALLLTAQAAVLATTTRNGGPITSFKSVTADDEAITESAIPVMVPGMGLNVGVPQGQQALLLITFSGTSACYDDSGTTMFCKVDVVVDGVPAAPGEVLFDTAADGVGYETNSMQWVSGPLGPGTYSVRVKYRVDEAGSFYFGLRTLTVLRSRV